MRPRPSASTMNIPPRSRRCGAGCPVACTGRWLEPHAAPASRARRGRRRSASMHSPGPTDPLSVGIRDVRATGPLPPPRDCEGEPSVWPWLRRPCRLIGTIVQQLAPFDRRFRVVREVVFEKRQDHVAVASPRPSLCHRVIPACAFARRRVTDRRPCSAFRERTCRTARRNTGHDP